MFNRKSIYIFGNSESPQNTANKIAKLQYMYGVDLGPIIFEGTLGALLTFLKKLNRSCVGKSFS